jgi:hypothetical protein
MSVNSKTLTYRYVLPTQVLAKCADRSLNATCVQATSGLQGAFDARSVCHQVIVPFDIRNERVLGGSPEPYINNPIRVPTISAGSRADKKDKVGWDALCTVVDYVEGDGDPLTVLRYLLIAIYERMSATKVTYGVPRRISIDQCGVLLAHYLAEGSGGDRALAVVAALLKTVGHRFGIFADVRRGNINASDRASGQTADVECLDAGGNLVLVAEVKDKALTLSHVEAKIPAIRSAGVSEVFFFLQQGIADKSVEAIADLRTNEFASGQNIYIVEIEPFANTLLALLGEAGRREFLAAVGTELDANRSAIVHRRKWAGLLRSVSEMRNVGHVKSTALA